MHNVLRIKLPTIVLFVIRGELTDVARLFFFCADIIINLTYAYLNK